MRAIRQVGGKRGVFPSDPSDPSELSLAKSYAKWLASDDPAIVANTIICLIHQANYLLDRQIARLEQHFVHDGGYTERLAAARIEERERQRASLEDPAPSPAPECPDCGGPMVRRTARRGSQAGSDFWGCKAYPHCKGTLPLH